MNSSNKSSKVARFFFTANASSCWLEFLICMQVDSSCLARRIHTPVCRDSICNRITAAVIMIQACLKLSVSLWCSSGIITKNKNQTTFAECSSSVSLHKWLSVLLLICAAARPEQVIVAVSRAEFGLRNSVLSWPFSKIQLMTPLLSIQSQPFMLFISHPDL